MAHTTRFAALAGVAAVFSFSAAPAAAAEISPLSSGVLSAPLSASTAAPQQTPGVFVAEEVNADGYRRYRGYRGYRGYRRNRVRTGDVIAGVLVLGGIAAIASAASKNNRERYRDRDYRQDDRRYRNSDYQERRDDRRGDSRYNGSRGIDSAVNQCVSQIERDVRVDSVDSVDRNGEGWRVTGSIYNGDRFTCRIGSDGKIDGVDYGAGFVSDASTAPTADRQHSDDRYAAAWKAADNGTIRAPEGTTPKAPTQASAPASAETEPQPAYPGGPLPGEEIIEDDRYRTAEATVTK
ncbi:MAG: hypothetical protein ABJ239_10175 [Erythrobacter sp.]